MNYYYYIILLLSYYNYYYHIILLLSYYIVNNFKNPTLLAILTCSPNFPTVFDNAAYVKFVVIQKCIQQII
jgi:hypothetical protein